MNNKNTIKPEMTVEAKARFFALYYGQMVFFAHKHQHPYAIFCKPEDVQHCPECFLELKPLSSITDEDAIEVAKIAYPSEENWSYKQHTSHKGESLIDETFYSDEDSFSVFGLNDPMGKLINITDFLRSRGYALHFMGWSVEQMVEVGWLKLSEKGGSSNG